MRTSQSKIANIYEVTDYKFDSGPDVIMALNEYVSPCTFTGMKSLLERSASRATADLTNDENVTPFLTNKASGD